MYDVLKIKQIMLTEDINQKELASKAGITAGTVSRLMLTGRAKHTTIIKIAQALSVAPKSLLRRSNDAANWS
ncbi:MAG: helix-turn-helix domain-containing protein [Saccharofermentanales bacterium]|jgi:DNA-binding Xre family transcriptional regulator|nr:helix-turn-helix transcriptional regulator [Clostridiaceae bacterium]